jgi:hypothetical protein
MHSYLFICNSIYCIRLLLKKGAKYMLLKDVRDSVMDM